MSLKHLTHQCNYKDLGTQRRLKMERVCRLDNNMQTRGGNHENKTAGKGERQSFGRAKKALLLTQKKPQRHWISLSTEETVICRPNLSLDSQSSYFLRKGRSSSLTVSSCGIPISDSISALSPVMPLWSEMVKLERGCELKKRMWSQGASSPPAIMWPRR